MGFYRIIALLLIAITLAYYFWEEVIAAYTQLSGLLGTWF